jgi:hypothetical protein
LLVSNADPGVWALTPQDFKAVPEPSIWATMMVGFAGLGFADHRRARAAAKPVVGRPKNHPGVKKTRFKAPFCPTRR